MTYNASEIEKTVNMGVSETIDLKMQKKLSGSGDENKSREFFQRDAKTVQEKSRSKTLG